MVKLRPIRIDIIPLGTHSLGILNSFLPYKDSQLPAFYLLLSMVTTFCITRIPLVATRRSLAICHAYKNKIWKKRMLIGKLYRGKQGLKLISAPNRLVGSTLCIYCKLPFFYLLLPIVTLSYSACRYAAVASYFLRHTRISM